jgi:hypothetical protein
MRVVTAETRELSLLKVVAPEGCRCRGTPYQKAEKCNKKRFYCNLNRMRPVTFHPHTLNPTSVVGFTAPRPGQVGVKFTNPENSRVHIGSDLRKSYWSRAGAEPVPTPTLSKSAWSRPRRGTGPMPSLVGSQPIPNRRGYWEVEIS